jgi:hypothetical protein
MTEVIPVQGEVVTPAAKPRRRNGDGRAVVKAEAGAAPAPVPQGDAFLAMIERAARDPSVDIDKMERLFQMHERAAANRAKAAYLAALAEMQPKLPVIAKLGTINKNEKDERGNKTGGQVAMTKYAKWEDINEAITPILGEYGFTLTHRISQPTEARISVTAVLGHKDGHTEETSMALPIDNSGAKNNVQGWGSSVSYGKRYTSTAILNLTRRGEDDDGKAAGADGFISEQQADGIRTELDELGADVQKFCEALGVEALAKIPTSKIEAAKVIIGMKRKAIKK